MSPEEVKKLSEQIDTVLDDLNTIKRVLIGDLEDIKQPGLVERVRTIETWIKKREWYEKIVIVAITVEAVGLGFLIFKTLIGM